jgi:hypothetical protein
MVRMKILQGAIMDWMKPTCLIETKSIVERFLLTPQGYIYGFMLTNGTEVYMPPLLSGEFHAAANPAAISSTCDWCGPH